MHIKSCQRTRIAPTPSGFLHLGNAFSFTVTAALAHLCGARIQLRIDDMDAARTAPEYLQDVFNTLLFLGIPWNDGPSDAEAHKKLFSQRLRLPHYEDAMALLRNSGMVFACSCARSARTVTCAPGCSSDCRSRGIALDHPGVAWRIDSSNAGDLVMQTFSGPMTYSFPDDMRDFIVRRKDGLPAYQLCSVVDDVLFEVDLVVRGQDLMSSTLAQLFLAKVLGYDGFLRTMFFHHRLLTAPEGEKLSKSAGSSSVQHLAAMGWSPAQVIRKASTQAGLGPLEHWKDYVDVIDRTGTI